MQEESGRDVGDVLERGLVDLLGRLLFGGEVGGGIPVRDALLDRVRFRPAEPGAIAAGVERGIGCGVDAVGAGVPGVEDVPAALVDRILLGPAGADG